MTDYASRQAVSQAADQWTDAVVQCRIYGHSWRHMTVTHRMRTYTIKQICDRCANTRQQDMDEFGNADGWKMTYDADYLLKGLGRVGPDGRSVLRIVSLRAYQIIEVEDD